MQASQLFAEIKDRREQALIIVRLEKLKHEPEKQGKALSADLIGYRSIRAVGQRYRIIYRVEPDKVMVIVVGIGRRKDGDKRDIYEVTKRFIAQMMSQRANE
ncbi:MAG: type II toxin-antitoxin system RelE/ParE family toxin [Oscillatoria sp. SIO1A7]|nr:type II toxin-antitoxin system RelE/ParE family toxin [Oscillatoria sp. SIO1A7]